MSRIEPTTDPRIVAALHRAGTSWRAVIGQRSNGSFTLVEAREFSADEESQLETWLDQSQVGRVICVLPASSVICRCVQLPDADPSQLDSALRLQAEMHLSEAAPEFRTAMAVLPAAEGEPLRSGLLTAWPLRAEAPEPFIERELTYAADVAALAALVNDRRPDGVAMWIDRNDGSIALAMPHAQGIVFRAARETGASAPRWRQGVGRLLAESALGAGHTEEFTEAIVAEFDARLESFTGSTAELIIPTELRRAARERLAQSPEDPAWWSRYGIAAGALLLTLGDMAPLAELRRVEPVRAPGPLDRVISLLGSRRAAAAWFIAALLIVGIGPLIFSGARLAVLHMKVGDLEDFERARNEREMRLRLYDTLAQNTWPMRKILADIVNAAPQGMGFTSISLEESSNRVDIQGEVDSQQLLLEMLRNLRESGVFDDSPHYEFNDRETGRPKFTVRPRVLAAHRPAKFEDDFAVLTLQERLYPNEFRQIREFEARQRGEGEQRAAATAHSRDDQPPTLAGADDQTTPTTTIVRPPVSRVHDDASSAGDDDDDETAAGNGTAVATGSEFGRTGPRSVQPRANIPALVGEGEGSRGPQMPEPKSEAEVLAMTRPELIAEMSRVLTAARHPGASQEQRDSLNVYLDQLRQRINNMPR